MFEHEVSANYDDEKGKSYIESCDGDCVACEKVEIQSELSASAFHSANFTGGVSSVVEKKKHLVLRWSDALREHTRSDTQRYEGMGFAYDKDKSAAFQGLPQVMLQRDNGACWEPCKQFKVVAVMGGSVGCNCLRFAMKNCKIHFYEVTRTYSLVAHKSSA